MQQYLRDCKYLDSKLKKAPIISSTSELTSMNSRRIQAQEYSDILGLSLITTLCLDYTASILP